MHKDSQSINMLKAKVFDGLHYVSKTSGRKFLPFLDPKEQEICREILEKNMDLQYLLFGGHQYCERKMLSIFPLNETLHIEDWPISIFHLKVKYNHKPLSHSSILGKLIHMGISRDRIGDIDITDSYIQLFVSKELKDYIVNNLDKIGNRSIEVYDVNWNDVIEHKPSFIEIQIIGNSLRLDLIISKIYRISRSDSSSKIKAGDVKLNWQENKSTNVLLKEKDVISVRGKGRAVIYKILGRTKKGNYKVIIHKYK